MNMWKLSNTFLNNLWLKDNIKKEIRNYFKTNENQNTTYQTYKM